MFETTSSKSTDKLRIICENINDKILSDIDLKNRVLQITINWKVLYLEGDQRDGMLVPELKVEFKP